MRFLIIFIILLTNTFASETIDIKNLIINKELKKYEDITFLDDNNIEYNLNDYQGNLILLNFWATWCAPCKEEMPSLDLLQSNMKLNNLKIFPINVGQDSIEKSSKFFSELNIKNLKIFFDKNLNFVKEFKLRGVPTTILINKEGNEFARIIGEVNFEDRKFLKWLQRYD